MMQKIHGSLLLGLVVVGVTGAASNRPAAATRRSTIPHGACRGPVPRTRGAAHRFAFPTGVAVDAAGTVYVADQGAHTICTVSPAGKVGLLAGDAGYASYDSLDLNGPGPTVRFNSPTGVAVDAAGAVYVADTGNRLIRRISPAGVVSTLAGQWGQPGSADGVGAAARFESPTGVAVDGAGTVYVADAGNSTIRRITPDGRVRTWAGQANQPGFTDGPGTSARFSAPVGLAVDAAGTVYVADQGNHRIRRISPAGFVTTLAGVATLAEIRGADGMYGARGSSDGSAATARFNGPTGVAVDARGTVYVGDSGNNTLRQINPAGDVRTVAGTPHTLGQRDGAGAAARFDNPMGVAVDVAGTVYVCDAGNHCIRTVSSTGSVRTLAGSRPGGNEPRGRLRRAHPQD